MRYLAIILSSKSKLCGKFQRLNTKLLKYRNAKIVDFQKISNKKKNYKTFYKTQTASCLKEIIQPRQPPISPDKILIHLWNKNFLKRYTEINKYLLSMCFKKVVLGRQEMVQCKCFFWHQTETCLLENL